MLVLIIASFVLRKVPPAWGMRTLLVPGAIAIAYVIFGDVAVPQGAVWRVLLAEAFFLYIWWLVALVFDLVFVWHWHIRSSRNPSPAWRAAGEIIRADRGLAHASGDRIGLRPHHGHPFWLIRLRVARVSETNRRK